MRTIYIDCAGVKSASELWQRYIDAAQPEESDHFGRNLDAFWDAIERGGPGRPGEAKLVFTRTADLASVQLANGGSFLEGLWRIARDATQTRVELL
jgi:RNAse (barnase) inhibitor barstar